MNDKLVPTKQPSFVVSTDGSVTRWQPTPPPAPLKLLTREERIDAYRAGIRMTTDALEALGFRLHYLAEHTASLEYKGYLFDFRIQRPELVAHIGGPHIPGTQRGKFGGSIYRLHEEIQSEFALQMIIGREFSAKPLFVALDESIPDPAQHIYDAVIGFLAALNDKQHRLGTSTVGKQPHLASPKELPSWIDV